MLDWHLGMAEGGDGRLRPRLAGADAVTLGRFWLVPAAWGTRQTRWLFPAVIAVGGASDWADGALARRAGRTRLGRDLDTTADLAFLTVAVAAALDADKLHPAAAAALGCRHAVGLTLSLGAYFGRARRPAIRARASGGVARVVGLTLAASGMPKSGAAILMAGCLVPPRSTAPGPSIV